MLQPGAKKSTYSNKLRKLHFLENLLDAKTQEKINTIKKEKTAMLIQTLGSKFKRQIFPKKLEIAHPQGKGLAKAPPGERQLLRGNQILKGLKDIQKRYVRREGIHSRQRKENAQPIMENIVPKRSLRQQAPRELKQLHRVGRWPGKLMENAFHVEPSFVQERREAVPSFRKQYSLGSAPATIAAKAPPVVKNKSKKLRYTLSILKDANAQIQNMNFPNPSSRFGKHFRFHKPYSHLIQRMPKARMNLKSRKEPGQMQAKRPLFSEVRSLINSPLQEALQPGEIGTLLSWIHLTFQSHQWIARV